MSAPRRLHAATQAALEVVYEYEPDPARCVAALLAVLAPGPGHEATAGEVQSPAVEANRRPDERTRSQPC